MFRVVLVFLSILFVSPLLKADVINEDRSTLLGDMPDLGRPVEVHGFFSQGFLLTTRNNFLPKSKSGTTEFAEAGINFNKEITSKLRAGAQLFARDFGRTGNYNAKFDWFLIDYRWRDWLGIRAGRIKIPYGLYNETQDIDMARAPVFLPQSVYPEDQRDFLLAQTGFDLYGYTGLSFAGALAYRFYRGTLQIDSVSKVGAPFQVATSDVAYVTGGRLLWETPLEGLNLAITYQTLELDSDLYFPSVAITAPTYLDVTMQVASLEYTNRKFQFASEYAKWRGTFGSTPAVNVRHERYYGMASYRVKEWFQPGAYYSETFPNIATRGEFKDFTKDTTVFARFDLTPNWLLKAEWHYIHGTANLNSQMNDNKALSDLDERWQMFVAKTTIYF